MPIMERRQDRRPWGLIVALVIASTAGLISLPLQVFNFRNLNAASAADVERNRRLVQQVKELEELGNRDVAEHRDRNELLHADLCRLIFEVVQTAPSLRDKGIRPCRPPLMPGQPHN